MKHNIETINDDVKKSLPHTTVLDDEVFEESEIMTLKNDNKRRKGRLDFFCSKPSIYILIITIKKYIIVICFLFL